LSLPDDPELRDRHVDALCHFWHRQWSTTAYLGAHAPFMENLSMLENFWLPLAWKRSWPLKRIYVQSRPHLSLLGWSDLEFERLMLCRPGDLPPAVLGRAQLLRASISKPDWLLIDASWFERPLLPLEQALFYAHGLLGDSRWLVFGPLSSPPLLPEDLPCSRIRLATY